MRESDLLKRYMSRAPDVTAVFFFLQVYPYLESKVYFGYTVEMVIKYEKNK